MILWSPLLCLVAIYDLLLLLLLYTLCRLSPRHPYWQNLSVCAHGIGFQILLSSGLKDEPTHPTEDSTSPEPMWCIRRETSLFNSTVTFQSYNLEKHTESINMLLPLLFRSILFLFVILSLFQPFCNLPLTIFCKISAISDLYSFLTLRTVPILLMSVGELVKKANKLTTS